MEDEGKKLVVKLEWGQSDAYVSAVTVITVQAHTIFIQLQKSDTQVLHAHLSGSALAQTEATRDVLTYIEVSSDQSESEDEAATLTKFLCQILEIPAVNFVFKSEVTAGQLFHCWRVLQDAHNKMKSLGWLKRGGKNIYIVRESE